MSVWGYKEYKPYFTSGTGLSAHGGGAEFVVREPALCKPAPLQPLRSGGLRNWGYLIGVLIIRESYYLGVLAQRAFCVWPVTPGALLSSRTMAELEDEDRPRFRV